MSGDADLTIVVERPAEVIFLARLLERPKGTAPRFFVTDERTGLATLARNILVHEGGPVLVVMNGETSNERAAAEKKGFVTAALRYVAGEDSFAVVVFSPALEAVVFEMPSVLQRRLGDLHLSESLLALGAVDPRGTLIQALRSTGAALEQFYRDLSAEDVRILTEGPQAAALLRTAAGLVAEVASQAA